MKAPREADMRKKLAALVRGAWAIAVVSIATQADARILAPLSGAYVMVSGEYRTAVDSRCGYTFNYLQRMTIEAAVPAPGPRSMLIATESVYAPGRHQLYLQGTCDGYNVYGVGSCACAASEEPPQAAPSCMLRDDGPSWPLFTASLRP
jgi:hypothetical protein